MIISAIVVNITLIEVNEEKKSKRGERVKPDS